ncbi:MAG TPA: hypothetical protein VK465_06910, partial [Fibrobacteria bacterium]|nr:hypothetical protein [Fibrobacteria bacterium]
MKRIIFINLVVGALVAAGAQEVPVFGRVTDPRGMPLQGVEMRILAGPWSSLTDADGRYYGLQPTISIRPPGQGSAPRT